LIQHANNLVLFLGRFHPVLVHLPVGGLVLLGFLELVAKVGHGRKSAQNGQWILGFVCVAAMFSSICGWMLATADGYDDTLLAWHRWLALSLTAFCLVTFVIRHREWMLAYRISLGATLFLLLIASHLGASITHGRDFLTRYAPAFLVPAQALAGQSPARSSIEMPLEQPIFSGVIQPILKTHCYSCHGPDKHKADLRLDSFPGLLRGGQDGPVIQAGNAKASPLIECMLSPPEADGHMPPEGQQQPTAQEITLLQWWIDAGAPVRGTAADLRAGPEILRLLATR
jgi:uncharacterized membrane protein